MTIIVFNNGDCIAPLHKYIRHQKAPIMVCRINNHYLSWNLVDPGDLWNLAVCQEEGPSNKVAFDYYTIGFDGTDYIGWEFG